MCGGWELLLYLGFRWADRARCPACGWRRGREWICVSFQSLASECTPSSHGLLFCDCAPSEGWGLGGDSCREHVQRPPHLLTLATVGASSQGATWRPGGSTRWPQERSFSDWREGRKQVFSLLGRTRGNLGVPTLIRNHEICEMVWRKEKTRLQRSGEKSSQI